MAGLYEDFIRNFYRHEVRELRTGREDIPWKWTPKNTAAAVLLPKMQTDVSLSSSRGKMIIECKYTPEAIATGCRTSVSATEPKGDHGLRSHQAAAEALPMRDAFAVLFFASMGMLFVPDTFVHSPGIILATLGIILVAKPLTALAITWALGFSIRTALTVAVSLAQIGEFSFILAELAATSGFLPVEGQGLLVSCALVSITVNPLLFRAIGPVEAWLHKHDRAWRMLSHRSEKRGRSLNLRGQAVLAERPDAVHAIVVGYGPVGQTVSRILKDFDIQPVIIDLNVDTIRSLSESGEPAIYGDASRSDILEAAEIGKARYLLLTLPDRTARTRVILAARRLNPQLHVFVRARYLIERAWLKELGATEVCYEETEAAAGLAALLLREVGADEEQIKAEIDRIRAELALRTPDVRHT